MTFLLHILYHYYIFTQQSVDVYCPVPLPLGKYPASQSNMLGVSAYTPFTHTNCNGSVTDIHAPFTHIIRALHTTPGHRTLGC